MKFLKRKFYLSEDSIKLIEPLFRQIDEINDKEGGIQHGAIIIMQPSEHKLSEAMVIPKDICIKIKKVLEKPWHEAIDYDELDNKKAD